jgi:hypothetical protein
MDTRRFMIYRVQNSLLPTSATRYINPVHTFPNYFLTMYCDIPHPHPQLHLGLTSSLFASEVPIKILYAFLISHACYMLRPSPPPISIALIVFDEEYKKKGSTVRSFVIFLVTSLSFRSYIFKFKYSLGQKRPLRCRNSEKNAPVHLCIHDVTI